MPETLADLMRQVGVSHAALDYANSAPPPPRRMPRQMRPAQERLRDANPGVQQQARRELGPVSRDRVSADLDMHAAMAPPREQTDPEEAASMAWQMTPFPHARAAAFHLGRSATGRANEWGQGALELGETALAAQPMWEGAGALRPRLPASRLPMREPAAPLPVNPTRELGYASDGSVLPVAPAQPFRNSLRSGSADLAEAAASGPRPFPDFGALPPPRLRAQSPDASGAGGGRDPFAAYPELPASTVAPPGKSPDNVLMTARGWVEQFGGGPEGERRAMRALEEDLRKLPEDSAHVSVPVMRRDYNAMIEAVRSGAYRQGGPSAFSKDVEAAFPDLYRPTQAAPDGGQAAGVPFDLNSNDAMAMRKAMREHDLTFPGQEDPPTLRPREPFMANLPQRTIAIRDLPAQRQGVDPNVVSDYVAMARRGEKPPPILVREVPGGFQVFDGLHRVEAARRAGVESLEAIDATPLFEPHRFPQLGTPKPPPAEGAIEPGTGASTPNGGPSPLPPSRLKRRPPPKTTDRHKPPKGGSFLG